MKMKIFCTTIFLLSWLIAYNQVDSEKIEFCYKINLAEEKTNLIQVFRVIHPSIGIGRTFIYEFNKPDQ